MTANSQEEQRIALFIDFENIAIGVRDAHYRRFDINLVLERLVEKGKILSKRAYADWGRYAEYRRSFHEAAIELIEVPQKSVGGKNSADIRLVVDAMDMSFQKEHIDCFCIASGDSDFSPLVSKLKENDKYVIGLGVKNSTSELLMENCDEFIFYEDLVRRQQAPTVVIPGLSEKQQEAFQILVDSVIALQLENKEALWGSMVKETMKRKKPSFNESYFGFRSFSHLLEDAQKRGIVTLRRDQKSGSYVVEDLGPAAQAQAQTQLVRPAETNGAVNGTNGHTAAAPAPTASNVTPAAATPVPTASNVPPVAASASPNATNGSPSPDDRTPDERRRRRRGGRGRGRGRDRADGSSSALDLSPENVDPAGDEPSTTDSDPDIRLDAPLSVSADAETEHSIETAQAADGLSAAAAPVLPAQALSSVAPALAGAQSEPADDAPSARSETPADRWIAQAPAPKEAPIAADKASFSLIGWLKGGN